MRHIAQVDVTLVRRMLHDFLVVCHNGEVLWAQRPELVDTRDEVHLDLLREGAQHFTLRHVDGLNGYTIDTLFGEDIGKESDAHLFRYNFHIFNMCQPAVNHQSVAESCIVERLGEYGTNAVEFLA